MIDLYPSKVMLKALVLFRLLQTVKKNHLTWEMTNQLSSNWSTSLANFAHVICPCPSVFTLSNSRFDVARAISSVSHFFANAIWQNSSLAQWITFEIGGYLWDCQELFINLDRVNFPFQREFSAWVIIVLQICPLLLALQQKIPGKHLITTM